MIGVLHDAIDARENLRESASDSVNRIWDEIRDRAKEITDAGGTFQELLEEIALEVEKDLARLTTEGVQAGGAWSLARQSVADAG